VLFSESNGVISCINTKNNVQITKRFVSGVSQPPFSLHRWGLLQLKPHVSKNRFCLVPPRMSLADYSTHSCDDHSHSHLNKAQVYELQSHGAIEWLRGSLSTATAKNKAVIKMIRYWSTRGLSCSVGSEIAAMLCDDSRRSIGASMLAHIKLRSEEQIQQSERPLCYQQS
jgi:hypothetical protein